MEIGYAMARIRLHAFMVPYHVNHCQFTSMYVGLYARYPDNSFDALP